MIRKTNSCADVLFASFLLLFALDSKAGGEQQHCSSYQTDVKHLYWGDLHVHTAYSLDAYAFGTLRTPPQAYQFARGGTIELADGSTVRLQRPLDFVAITDHAEWFDLMYLCTDPNQLDDPYCDTLRNESSYKNGRSVFNEYVVPTITKTKPQKTEVCAADERLCKQAAYDQWQRIQQHGNDANEPCEFTALLGFEWSASPSGSHAHRNVIFASEAVTDEAIDYIRFPSLESLLTRLDTQCRADQGCYAITIPHNTNLSDGVGFDVESERDRILQLRSRYERLVEVHQEKANSECLPPFGKETGDDCDFEVRTTDHAVSKARSAFSREAWERMRGGYARGLLLRGLAAYEMSGEKNRNPLQLGLIASTDNHAATPGYVEEDTWQGSVFGFGDLDRNMARIESNPGGLVAVWAEQNTRASIFAALKRREVYGTSGPRIGLKFAASTSGEPLSCGNANSGENIDVVMGGEFNAGENTPQFQIIAQADKQPLARIEIIKGEWIDGELREKRIPIWAAKDSETSICQIWSDPEFEASAPAFWYARILEQPTQRWSAVRCKQAGRCDEFPDAVQTIQERAWASPIWFLPSD